VKKIVTILTTLMIIFIGTVASYGETGEANVELSLTPSVEVEADAKTVTLTLSLGSFTGIEEGCVMGYEGVLSYDTNVIESVKVEGANGWVADASPTTMVITGDTSAAMPNTEITRIVCTLKDGVEPGSSTSVSISNILLTNHTYDFEFNKTATIQVKEVAEPTPTPTPDEQGTQDGQPEQQKPSNGGEKKDGTVAKTPIPQTGVKTVAIGIVAIVAIGIFSFIKVKTIKLK